MFIFTLVRNMQIWASFSVDLWILKRIHGKWEPFVKFLLLVLFWLSVDQEIRAKLQILISGNHSGWCNVMKSWPSRIMSKLWLLSLWSLYSAWELEFLYCQLEDIYLELLWAITLWWIDNTRTTAVSLQRCIKHK